MYTHKITVTVSGSAGSATGSGQTRLPVNGKIAAVYVDYTSQPSTADVVIATAGNNSPAQTILSLTNANTDGWYYPQAQIHKNDGTALTFNGTQIITDKYPVDDHVAVTVAQGNAGSVDVYLIVEC